MSKMESSTSQLPKNSVKMKGLILFLNLLMMVKESIFLPI